MVDPVQRLPISSKNLKREEALDILRGLAILLVLTSHYPIYDIFLHFWVGVDLFFVLSGYLITKMIHGELERTGNFNALNFFIRRGLKIYPSFYFFLFFTVTIVYFARTHDIHLGRIVLSKERLFAEIFFLQNYLPNIWGTDWSIAIEEHFYFSMAVIAFFASKCLTPSKSLIFPAVLFMVLVPIIRIYTNNQPGAEEMVFHLATHLRIDSLFSGVITYFTVRRFKNSRFLASNLTFFGLLFFGSSVVCFWFFIFPESRNYTIPFGFTVIYTGFSIILLACMLKPFKNSSLLLTIIGRTFSFVGRNSYNIYLWHLFVVDMIYYFMFHRMGIDIFSSKSFPVYLAYIFMSIFVGYSVTKLVELPILSWRDNRFIRS